MDELGSTARGDLEELRDGGVVDADARLPSVHRAVVRALAVLFHHAARGGAVAQ